MSDRQRPPVSPLRAWYLTGLCTACLLMSFVDRQILSLMIGPVRAALAINDLQFGLLNGLAFSLFYATLGMPIAIIADRSSRIRVIAIAVAFWSVATIACGFARNFTQLFIARIGVGAGEAGLGPATYSLLADVFPRDRLGRAAAIFSLGSFVGGGIAFLGGGALIEAITHSGAQTIAGMQFAPYQLVFMLVGIPGVLLALLVVTTVTEPRRGHDAAGETCVSFRRVLAMLWHERKVFGPHIIGFALSAMALFGLMGWSPAYLMRGFGFSAAEAGFAMGTIILVMGTAGVCTSGWLLDRLNSRGREDTPFLVGAIGTAGTLLGGSLLGWAGDGRTALAVLTVTTFFASFPMPPSAVVIQTAVARPMRAQVSAIFLCLNSMIGLALGSALIGLLNDQLFRAPDGIRASLTIIVGGSGLVAALLLASGRRPYAERVRALNRGTS